MAHNTTWKNNGICWDIYGILEPDEIVEFNEELSDHAELEKLSYFIWDATKVTEINIDTDDANLAAIFGKLINEYNKKMKGAFVVHDTRLQALVKEYINHSDELGSTWTFMLFDNIEDAYKRVAS